MTGYKICEIQCNGEGISRVSPGDGERGEMPQWATQIDETQITVEAACDALGADK